MLKVSFGDANDPDSTAFINNLNGMKDDIDKAIGNYESLSAYLTNVGDAKQKVNDMLDLLASKGFNENNNAVYYFIKNEIKDKLDSIDAPTPPLTRSLPTIIPSTTSSTTSSTTTTVPLSYCGNTAAVLESFEQPDNWNEYACIGRDEAEAMGFDFDSECYSRSQYSDIPGSGCLGDERCCPPPEVKS